MRYAALTFFVFALVGCDSQAPIEVHEGVVLSGLVDAETKTLTAQIWNRLETTVVYPYCGIAEVYFEQRTEGRWERLPGTIGQCTAFLPPFRQIAPGQTASEVTLWSDAGLNAPGLYRILMPIQGAGTPDTTYSAPFTISAP